MAEARTCDILIFQFYLLVFQEKGIITASHLTSILNFQRPLTDTVNHFLACYSAGVIPKDFFFSIMRSGFLDATNSKLSDFSIVSISVRFMVIAIMITGSPPKYNHLFIFQRSVSAFFDMSSTQTDKGTSRC